MHSLHAYFLVAGDVNAPIVYEVDVARDGKSFSNRRVVAIQHGQPIFNMTASFQVPEEGLEHAAPMPQVPGPEGLADVRELPPDVLEKVPEKMRRFLTHERPFEFRPVEPIHVIAPPRAAPRAPHLGQDRRRAARRRRPAPQRARVRLGLSARLDGDAAARHPLRRRQRAAREPRSRDVVPSAVSRRRVAALRDGEPERVGRARARARAGSSRATAGSSRRRRKKASCASGGRAGSEVLA